MKAWLFSRVAAAMLDLGLWLEGFSYRRFQRLYQKAFKVDDIHVTRQALAEAQRVLPLLHPTVQIPVVRCIRQLERRASWQWDRQIEADALAGRLDANGSRAIAEHEAGCTTPL